MNECINVKRIWKGVEGRDWFTFTWIRKSWKSTFPTGVCEFKDKITICNLRWLATWKDIMQYIVMRSPKSCRYDSFVSYQQVFLDQVHRWFNFTYFYTIEIKIEKKFPYFLLHNIIIMYISWSENLINS